MTIEDCPGRTMDEPELAWTGAAGMSSRLGLTGGDGQLPPGIRAWSDAPATVPSAVRKYEIVVVGCSLGGMHALETLLSALPDTFPLPIVVAQHRYRTSNETLPAYYSRHSTLRVVDADDKQRLRAGEVYLAPANYHLLINNSDGCAALSLSVDAAVGYSRPSIDVMFESAAEAFGAGVIGVVLTGANSDGARGAVRIRQKGGFLIVQDPDTAEAPAMPQAAIAAGRVDQILPLDRIGPFLVELCRTST